MKVPQILYNNVNEQGSDQWVPVASYLEGEELWGILVQILDVPMKFFIQPDLNFIKGWQGE